MKKKVIYFVLSILLLITFFWIFNHSYVEVTLENSKGSGVAYSLLNQANQKTVEAHADGAVIKKLVSRGSYELEAKEGETSYFAVIKSGGFLTHKAVQAKVAPEKNRKFVGNNPGACTYYLNQTLLSFSCGASFSKVQIHIPATSSQPTYTTGTSSVLEGAIEGIIKTSEGNIALLRSPGIDEDQGAPHTAYLLGDNLRLTRGVALPGLNKDRTYSILAYKEGFIVYDNLFEQILYYTTREAKPVSITVDKPAGDKLSPSALSVNGDSIVITYSNNAHGEIAPAGQTDNKKLRSETVIKQNNQSKHFNFKKQLDTVLFCGTDKLCLLTGKSLEVYEISGSKPKLLFAVSGVGSIENYGSNLLVARSNEILDLDVDKQEGSIQYSLGDYKACGIQTDSSGYTLCLVNNKGKKVALRFSPQQTNTDSIDKKVSALLKLTEIKDVSIYDKYIYISPNLGEVVYDAASKSFDYDPNTKRTVNTKLNQEVDKLGIDRNTYHIINTLE